MTSSEIEQDVKQKIRAIFEKAAYDISFEIEGTYESTIDRFYNSYTPKYYDRGYNLYNASSCSENISNEIEVSINDDISWFKAGIKLNPSKLGDPYSDPQEYVFDRSYFYGIHGTIRTGGLMVVPPERLMNMWFESFKANIGNYIKKYLRI